MDRQRTLHAGFDSNENRGGDRHSGAEFHPAEHRQVNRRGDRQVEEGIVGIRCRDTNKGIALAREFPHLVVGLEIPGLELVHEVTTDVHDAGMADGEAARPVDGVKPESVEGARGHHEAINDGLSLNLQGLDRRIRLVVASSEVPEELGQPGGLRGQRDVKKIIVAPDGAGRPESGTLPEPGVSTSGDPNPQLDPQGEL